MNLGPRTKINKARHFRISFNVGGIFIWLANEHIFWKIIWLVTFEVKEN